MLELRFRYLFLFVAVWSVVGFPLLAGVTTTLDLTSTNYSVVLRGLALFAAVLLLFSNVRVSSRLALCLLLVFWIAYLLRLFVSQFILGERTTLPLEGYWIWGVGASFVPSLAVLVSFKSNWVKPLGEAFLYTAFAATIILLLAGGTSIITYSGEFADQNRWNLDSLNPISVGHLGVTTILVGVGMLLSGVKGWTRKSLVFAAIGLGSVLTIYANSRGPFISLVAAIGLMLTAGARHRRTWWLIFAVLLATAIAGPKIADVLFSTGGIFDRFSGISSDNDLSIRYRQIAFQGAWNQFVQNPIFGNAIEEQITQYYPHNVVLEALMSTGLIGGVPFIGVIIIAVYSAWNIVRRGAGDRWIGLLTIQYIAAYQFSGALASATPMWMMISLSIACYATSRTERRAPTVRTRSAAAVSRPELAWRK